MKLKQTFTVLLGLLLLATTASCGKKSDIKSLKEMKRDEKKAIQALITKLGIEVQEAKEGQSYFDPNIMYHFDNGLYMQVLDKGTDKPVVNETRVGVRMKGYTFKHKQDSIYVFNSINYAHQQQSVFLYTKFYQDGEVHFQLIEGTSGTNLDRFVCEGIAYPMTLLGDGAIVRLIVPFSLGPISQYSSGISVFYDEVDYVFEK